MYLFLRGEKSKSSEGRQSYGLYMATVTSAVTMHLSTCKYSNNKHGLGLCGLRSVSIQKVTYLFQIMHLFFIYVPRSQVGVC